MPTNPSPSASASTATNSIPINLRLLSADGCCLQNPGGAIGLAVVDCNGALVAGGGLAPALCNTNNVAELLALMAAATIGSTARAEATEDADVDPFFDCESS